MILTPELLRGASDRLSDVGLSTFGDTFMCNAVEEHAYATHWGQHSNKRNAHGLAARREFELLLKHHGVCTFGTLHYLEEPFTPSGPNRQALRFDFLNLLACEMETNHA